LNVEMGFSFRKGFKLGKGSRLNLSKKGFGLSFGGKGLRIGTGSGRAPRVSGGFGPFRFFKSLRSGKKARADREAVRESDGSAVDEAGSGCAWVLFIVVGVVVGVWLWPSRNVKPANGSPPSSAVVAPVPEKTANSPQPQAAPSAAESIAAQKRAMAVYPALGVSGSPLNREFVARHKRYQTEKPDFFTDPEWPTKLAAECALAVGQNR
jgi:hypothetical protein